MSKKSKNSISRRNFIGLTGGASLAAIASLGVATDWALNDLELDLDELEIDYVSTDVLVIGSGMAGLFAAVKAHDAGANVMMVSKGRLGASGQTPFAKGIFAYDPSKEKLSIDEFVDTVSRSALGTNNPVYTKQMAVHSLARVNDLKEWGFFDSSLYHKSFSKPIEERNIPIQERIVITHLIKEDGMMKGAAGFSVDKQKVIFYQAKSVILCTGAGGFKPNGFPICDLTHDGTIMAYNIGAKVTGKEWNDGHPARAENPAACYDGWGDMFEKKPGTTGIEVHHDLGVDMNYMAYVNGNPLKMGPPGARDSKDFIGGPYTPAEFRRNDSRPPQGGKEQPRDRKRPDKESGGPPGMGGGRVGGSSAGMAIHKAEGLVPINDQCESNIPGLYAAGDALGSYMAGTIYTQIGSSLAGSAVQGGVAGKAAANYSKSVDFFEISPIKIIGTGIDLQVDCKLLRG